jgi:hypothetical protein
MSTGRMPGRRLGVKGSRFKSRRPDDFSNGCAIRTARKYSSTLGRPFSFRGQLAMPLGAEFEITRSGWG